MSTKYTRRDFLKSSAIAAVGASTFTAASYSRILGANDRVNFAIIGVRGRGREHANSIVACKNTSITHICDVDERFIETGSELVKELTGKKPKAFRDIRKLLESKKIDAITIATPEHWHAHMTVMGLEAGKHVYVEKPPCHNPAEADLIVAAQEKYGLQVQMGNQQRSSYHTIEAMKRIHDGEIGDVYMGKAWYSNNRGSIGVGKEVPVPDYLDWELWQGPAPRRVYKDNYHPYNWHWFWHYGTGETLNNGTHEVDLCVWALKAGYPKKVTASGGRYHFADDWQFYDTLVTSYEYDDKMITWEGRSCNNMQFFNRGRGATIHGTKGTLLIDRNGYEIYDNDMKKTFVYEKKEKDVTTGLGGGGPMTDEHFQNFINAIQGKDNLHSPIKEGVVAVKMLLLSNIAWKYGRVLNLDQKTGKILDDPEAMSLWQRDYEPGWELKLQGNL